MKHEQRAQPAESTKSGSAKRMLTLAAVLGFVSGGWLVLAPWLGHMGLPLPCVALGAAILVGTVFAHRGPANRVAWSLLILAAALFALLLGQAAVVPALVGIAAGGLFMMIGGVPNYG